MSPVMLNLHANGVAQEKATLVDVNNRISLSQWCFHRAIFGDSRKDYNQFVSDLHSKPDSVLRGDLDPRGIVEVSRELGVDRVDLVNVLFFGHAQNKAWLNDFKKRANDHDVSFQLLMCDQTGNLGASSIEQRKLSIEAHKPWLDAAAHLDCKQLRVNAYGDGTYLQQLEQCAESLEILATLAEGMGIQLLVENHGHASNNGAWLAMLMQQTNHDNLGVFTDLDNFFMGGWGLQPERRYDRVQGLLDLAPYTKGVSVKSHDFDKEGKETTLDYLTLFDIFESNGFSGLYSIEYEGKRLSELEGTKSTIHYCRQSVQDIIDRA